MSSFRHAKFANGESLAAFSLSSPTVTYTGGCAASTDPFSGKTNKYAESSLLRITAKAKGLHLKFGTSAIGDATTSDFYLPAEETILVHVDSSAPYLRVIEAAATAAYFITEIY